MSGTKAELRRSTCAVRNMPWNKAVKSRHAALVFALPAVGDRIDAVARSFCGQDGQEWASFDEVKRVAEAELIRLIIECEECDSVEQVVGLTKGRLTRCLEEALDSGKLRSKDNLAKLARRYGKYLHLARKAGKSNTDEEIAQANGKSVEEVSELRQAHQVHYASVGHYENVVAGKGGRPVVIRPRRRGGPRQDHDSGYDDRKSSNPCDA